MKEDFEDDASDGQGQEGGRGEMSELVAESWGRYLRQLQLILLEQLTASPWNNMIFMIYYDFVVGGIFCTFTWFYLHVGWSQLELVVGGHAKKKDHMLQQKLMKRKLFQDASVYKSPLFSPFKDVSGQPEMSYVNVV